MAFVSASPQPSRRDEIAGGVAVIRRLLEEGRAGYDSLPDLDLLDLIRDQPSAKI